MRRPPHALAEKHPARVTQTMMTCNLVRGK